MSKALIKLSDNDAFLGSVMKQDLSMFAEMPPTEVLADIQEAVRVLVKGEGILGAVGLRLGAALARVAKDQLFIGYGYESLKAFEAAELEGKGAAHSTIWQYKKIVEAFPTIDAATAIRVGPKKLTKASMACNEFTSDAQKQQLLARAEESPSVKEYTEYIEGPKVLSAPGSTKTAKVEILCTGDEAAQFWSWMGDGRLKEFAQSDAPMRKILAAIEEASSVFPVERAKGDMTIHVKPRPPKDEGVEF